MKCQLCEREVLEIEFHHFYPGKKRRINDSGIDVCIQCGDQIHLMFSNQELRDKYHDLPSLKEAMHKYILWIQKKPERRFCVKKKK